MRRQFRRFLRVTSLVVFIVLTGNSGYSCGTELGFDTTMFLLFQRDLQGDAALQPFCYAQQYLYDYTPDPLKSDQRRNCAEWRAFTGNAVTDMDVYNVQYNITPQQYLYCYRTGNWGGLADNPFIKWLQRKENKAAAQYMAFARRVEYEGACEGDPWHERTYRWDDGGTSEFDLSAYDSLTNSALQQCKNTSGFLQQRYAFQAIKLIYYGNFYDTDTTRRRTPIGRQLIDCYDTYLKDRPTILSDWALVYYANVQSDRMKRAYYLVKAFDRSNEKKVFVYLTVSRKELAQLKTTTREPGIKAAIATIEGLKNPGRALATIKEVYSYDPTSKYIPVLVNREVNKLEDWIWSPQIKGFESDVRIANAGANYGSGSGSDSKSSTAQRDEVYLNELRQFLITIAGSNTANSNYLKLSIVHLYHLQRNFTDALPYLNSINVVGNDKYAVQLDIEKALSVIYAGDILQPATKQRLNDIFAHLTQLGIVDTSVYKHDWSGIYDPPGQARLLRDLYLLLSTEYKRKGDIVTAGLLFQKSSVVVNEYFGGNGGCRNIDTPGSEYPDGSYYYRISYFEKYASPTDLDALLTFKHKRNYTAFENRLQPCRWPSDDVYLDLKGTLLLRQEKYKEALAVFNKVRPDFWATTYAYKYYLRKSSVTSVGSLLPAASGSGKRYALESKREIVKEIVDLQDSLLKATDDRTRARISFMLGNCFYNISYAGKDWMAHSYGKGGSEHEDNKYFAYYSFNTTSHRQYDNYYKCANAIEMYSRAIKYAGSDQELGAQCLLMLSMCDGIRYEYGNHKYVAYENRYLSPYLGVLAKQYNRSKVLGNAADECPDVQDYIKRNKIKLTF